MSKRIFPTSFILLISSLAIFAVVFAQEDPESTYCGDSIVQSPNDNNKFEKCDDGMSGSERCTAECGQKMLGWAWADTIGWASLNYHTCDEAYLAPDYLPPNPAICQPQPQLQEYFLEATADNQVLGWAWSDNAGWICFGVTCEDSCGGSCTVPYGSLPAVLDLADPDRENPQVLGWAKIVSLGGDGWISLNCRNNDICGTADYQVRLGYNDFSGENRLTLKGWAWNPYTGWVWFSPEIAGASPWLQTKHSDIYGRLELSGNLPPSSACNATYRILAGGAISNFCSAQGEDWVEPESPAVNFPATETLYSNVLGRLDLDGLLCDFNNQPTCVNRYGLTVIDAAGWNFSNVLGNKIYYYEGDLDMAGFTFSNGSDFESGAGTIIINGNLNINGDIAYAPADPATSFRNLASAAWIVLGDLRIAPGVEKLAGNFIVLGNGAACDPTSEVSSGCGQVYTCCSGTFGPSMTCVRNDYPPYKRLTVSGLMMAKKFYFDRFYVNPNEAPLQGSEVIIYDGRLLANIPPGLSDFAKALPVWRSGGLAQ